MNKLKLVISEAMIIILMILIMCLLSTYYIPGAVLNILLISISVFYLVFTGLCTKIQGSLAGLPKVIAFHWLPLWDCLLV